MATILFNLDSRHGADGNSLVSLNILFCVCVTERRQVVDIRTISFMHYSSLHSANICQNIQGVRKFHSLKFHKEVVIVRRHRRKWDDNIRMNLKEISLNIRELD